MASWDLWKLLTSSSVCMSSSLIHESCAGEYPLHLTRYCFFFHWPKVHCFRMDSTFHSGMSSTMLGGGSRKFGLCSLVSSYSIKREVWKMSWIFQALERLIWYATWEILVATSKGLYCLGDSFGVPSICFRLVPSSHTLSLGWYSLKHGVVLPSYLSCTLCRASRAAVLDSLILLRHCCKSGMSVLHVGWCASGA